MGDEARAMKATLHTLRWSPICPLPHSTAQRQRRGGNARKICTHWQPANPRGLSQSWGRRRRRGLRVGAVFLVTAPWTAPNWPRIGHGPRNGARYGSGAGSRSRCVPVSVHTSRGPVHCARTIRSHCISTWAFAVAIAAAAAAAIDIPDRFAVLAIFRLPSVCLVSSSILIDFPVSRALRPAPDNWILELPSVLLRNDHRRLFRNATRCSIWNPVPGSWVEGPAGSAPGGSASTGGDRSDGTRTQSAHRRGRDAAGPPHHRGLIDRF
mmetsp:Transcript_16498/g.44885  ORF Transcript_16498/g.44885 Transcript_16498/m.44885 type:complete len:267 (-) Transcript_16498:5176-5976(-)